MGFTPPSLTLFNSFAFNLNKKKENTDWYKQYHLAFNRTCHNVNKLYT